MNPFHVVVLEQINAKRPTDARQLELEFAHARKHEIRQARRARLRRTTSWVKSHRPKRAAGVDCTGGAPFRTPCVDPV